MDKQTRHSCFKITSILSEWDVLPIILNNEKAGYLEMWKMIFKNDAVTPFTNMKVERMFSSQIENGGIIRRALGKKVGILIFL